MIDLSRFQWLMGQPSFRFASAAVSAILFCWLWPALSIADTAAVRLVSGDEFRAKFVGLSGTQLQFQKLDSDEVAFEPSQLVGWGSWHEGGAGPQIHLIDGSILIADVLGTTADGFEVGINYDRFGDAELWEKLQLPRASVRLIVLRPPQDPLARDRAVSEWLKESSADRIFLRSGDLVTGRVVPPPAESHRKPLAWIKPRDQAASIHIAESRVRAIRLADRARAATSVTQFGFSDGSFLNVRSWSQTQSETTLRLQCGAAVRLANEVLAESLTFIQVKNSAVRYLSDLPEVSYRHVPFLTLEQKFQTNRNSLGGRLRVAGRTYPMGLGMGTTSRLVYRVPPQSDRFEAEIAIDDAAGGKGSARFHVFVNGETTGWKSAFRSDVVRGGQPPVPIRVPLKGAKSLALIVDYADQADQFDYANWLAPRIVVP